MSYILYMPNTRSHVQKQGRRYSGEEQAENLIEWLSLGTWGGKPAVKQPQGYSTVMKILELWRDLRAAFEISRKFQNGELTSFTYEKLPPYTEKLEQLQKLLFGYKYYPMMFPWVKWTSVNWFPAKGGLKKNKHGWPATYNDSNAVFDIAQLAEMELLHRVQQCVCGEWFFGRFEHQRFCSAKCRENTFHSSPEWKEYRRTKAREYYALHKSGKVR
jgi:hypothetical protein